MYKVRLARDDELLDVQRLFDTVWGPPEPDWDDPKAVRAYFESLGNLHVPQHELVTHQHSGGFVIIAELDGQIVGALYGFPGMKLSEDCWYPIHKSHIMGVLAEHRSAGVGELLKRQQLELCFRQGLSEISWTYWHLESANALLNLAKLGGVVFGLLRDVYGQMKDERNSGVPSDRFLIQQHITSQHCQTRLARAKSHRSTLEQMIRKAEFVLTAVAFEDQICFPGSVVLDKRDEFLLVEVPSNIQAIRSQNPRLAQDWALATREVFEHYLIGVDDPRCHCTGQYAVVDFISEIHQHQGRRSFYVLQRDFRIEATQVRDDLPYVRRNVTP